MILSMIAAASENNVIGKDNDLVWHMPNDFKYFKQKTEGHTIIMGRKTMDSLGKPLKNRRHIVITRNEAYQNADVEVVNSLEASIKQADADAQEEVFIIGGASIYKQALSFANRIYLTRIHGTFEGDAFFPELNDEWKLISEDKKEADERHKYDYTFMIFERQG